MLRDKKEDRLGKVRSLSKHRRKAWADESLQIPQLHGRKSYPPKMGGGPRVCLFLDDAERAIGWVWMRNCEILRTLASCPNRIVHLGLLGYGQMLVARWVLERGKDERTCVV